MKWIVGAESRRVPSRAATRHFVINGKVRPVATVMFVRKSP